VGEVISAFTEEQASRLTGVSIRQLRYWDHSRFFEPSLAYEDRARAYSRLYSFRDLVSLKLLDALRNKAKVPLQELRRAKNKLIRLGEDLWQKVTLYVLGKRVVFFNPETDSLEEVVSGQTVMQFALAIEARDMRASIVALGARGPDRIGKFERRRGIARNQVVIAGTRIPVRSIKAFADEGYSVERIRREYPTLTEDDIRAAISYVAA